MKRPAFPNELPAGFSYWILLANRGNPDHAQNPRARVFGTPRDTWAGARNLGHASALAQAYRNENSLGAGNWTGGQVLDRDGQQVARVAFNGRVFAHPDESLLIEASHPADYGLESSHSAQR